MEHLAPEVERELSRLGPSGSMIDILAAWPRVVGEAVARNAWPARWGRDGTLHVHTSSAAWAFELAHLQPVIAARLRQALGESAPPGLRFSPGPLPEPPTREPRQGTAVPSRTSPEVEEEARRLVAGMGESELAQAIARAAALGLARAGSSRAL